VGELLTMAAQGVALCVVIGGVVFGVVWAIFRWADYVEGRGRK